MKSATKAQRISQLADYITSPENRKALEKCVHSECLNFITDDYETQKMEMLALADEAIRSKDTIDHWVISWQPHERPTIEQAQQAVEIFMKHTGLEGHQCIWGLHDDTDSMHVHVEINRVHQDSLKVIKINKGFWKEAGQQVACLIEHEQGWQGVPGARYEIQNGKLIKLDTPEKGRKPDSVAESKEIQTGEKSAQRIGIEEAGPIIAQATSWRELHAGLAAAGMEYRREGSGAKVYVGNIGIKASDVDRKAAFGALQKRLGQFQPAKEINRNDYHHHTPQPYSVANGPRTPDSMRSLSKCNLAHSDKGRDGKTKREGVLQLDARSSRQRADGMRRDAGRRTDRTGPDTNRTDTGLRLAETDGRRSDKHLHHLKPDQAGWKEYNALKDERKAAKEKATAALKKEHEARRNALFEKQKAERKDILSGNWKGKGDARNAIQSVLAVQHAAAKAELQAEQSRERKELQAEFAPLPQYKAWAEQPRLVQPLEKETDEIQIKAVSLPSQSQQLANTLRSLSSKTDRHGTTYDIGGHAMFRDEGKNIALLDLRSDEGIAAALATAQQKFGSKLTLTGSPEAQRRIVEVAVAQGLSVKFADKKLEEYRLGLKQSRATETKVARIAERTATQEQSAVEREVEYQRKHGNTLDESAVRERIAQAKAIVNAKAKESGKQYIPFPSTDQLTRGSEFWRDTASSELFAHQNTKRPIGLLKTIAGKEWDEKLAKLTADKTRAETEITWRTEAYKEAYQSLAPVAQTAAEKPHAQSNAVPAAAPAAAPPEAKQPEAVGKPETEAAPAAPANAMDDKEQAHLAEAERILVQQADTAVKDKDSDALWQLHNKLASTIQAANTELKELAPQSYDADLHSKGYEREAIEQIKAEQNKEAHAAGGVEPWNTRAMIGNGDAMEPVRTQIEQAYKEHMQTQRPQGLLSKAKGLEWDKQAEALKAKHDNIAVAIAKRNAEFQRRLEKSRPEIAKRVEREAKKIADRNAKNAPEYATKLERKKALERAHDRVYETYDKEMGKGLTR